MLANWRFKTRVWYVGVRNPSNIWMCAVCMCGLQPRRTQSAQTNQTRTWRYLQADCSVCGREVTWTFLKVQVEEVVITIHSFVSYSFHLYFCSFDYVLHSFLITSFTFALSLIISFIVSPTPSFYFYFHSLCFLYSLFSFTLFASFIGYSLLPCPCFFHSFFSSTLSYVPFTLNLLFSSLFLVLLTCL